MRFVHNVINSDFSEGYSYFKALKGHFAHFLTL